jgi:hypothetical protein
MGISCRMFLLDQDDSLYRLSSAKFNQMLRDPTSCRLTRFAGARVRMTNVAVELLDRQPIRVVWNTFGFLAFDDEGYFDSGTFDHHQRPEPSWRGRRWLLSPREQQSSSTQPPASSPKEVRWKPTRTLQRHIDDAALGRVKCPRL